MATTSSPNDQDIISSEQRGFYVQEKIVLILCGLIASGKSTFAESLQQHCPQFRRCNQDDLGDRRRVEQLARESLNKGLSVCIDRTNFNASQRSHWIEIARNFPGTLIWVIVFDTPYETCAARLRERSSHPTIMSPEQGLQLLSRFAADFQRPNPGEGYDRILYVKPSDHPSAVYSQSDISAILHRVHTSPAVVHSSSSSGNYNTGHAPFNGSRRAGHYNSAGRCYQAMNQGFRYGGNIQTRTLTGSRGRHMFRRRGTSTISQDAGHSRASTEAHSRTPDRE